MDKTGTLERGEFLKIMRLLSEKDWGKPTRMLSARALAHADPKTTNGPKSPPPQDPKSPPAGPKIPAK
eukprot:1618420-Amphidinium_carterae.1